MSRGAFAGERFSASAWRDRDPGGGWPSRRRLVWRPWRNLVLLAENRLSLPTEDRVTALRVGFLGQFLLIAAWTLSFVNEPASVRSERAQALGVLGGLHLAVVAMFTVTEDLVVPAARAAAHESRVAMAVGLLAIFRPGGGRGAIYVLAQMALFLAAAWLLRPTWVSLRWSLAVCGYICFFTGLPAAAFRFMRPARAASFQLRVAVLVLLSIGPGAARHPLLRAVAAGSSSTSGTPAAICSIPSGRWRTGPSWKRITGSRYRSCGAGGTARLPGADPPGDAHDGAASPDRSASVRQPQR